MPIVENLQCKVNLFQKESIENKTEAVGFLPAVAEEIGASCVQSQLAPLINMLAKEDEDVLSALSLVIGRILAILPPGEISCLAPSFFILCNSDDFGTRKNGIDAVVEAAKTFTKDNFRRTVIPLLDAYKADFYDISKIALSEIIPGVYKRALELEIDLDIDGLFLQYCNNQNPLVRKASIKLLNTLLSNKMVLKDPLSFIEHYQLILFDKSETVQFEAILSLEKVVSHLLGAYDNKYMSLIVKLIESLSQDISWRVRRVLSDNLVSLCKYLDEDCRNSSLLEVYLELASDVENEVVFSAAKNISDFSTFISIQSVATKILPVAISIIDSPIAHNRSALLSNLTPLVNRLADSEYTEQLTVLLDTIFSFPAEAILNFIIKLHEIKNNSVLRPYSASIKDDISCLALDKNWRNRIKIAAFLSKSIDIIGVESLDEDFFGFFGILLRDRIFSVRETSSESLCDLARAAGKAVTEREIVPLLLNVLDNKSYLLRGIALKTLTSISLPMNSPFLEENVIPKIAQRASDKVPNIRVLCAKFALSPSPAVRGSPSLRAMLKTLQIDGEEDVRRAAEEAIAALSGCSEPK